MRPASPVLFIPPSKTNTKYFGRHLRETDTAAEVSKLERTGIIKEAGEGLLQIRNSGLLVYWIINNCYIKLKMLQLR